MSDGPKRLRVPDIKRNNPSTVQRAITTDTMMEDLNHILYEQIEKQRLKSKAATFDISEVKVIGELADAVVKLSREERERLKSDELAKLFEKMDETELRALIGTKT